MKGNFLAIRKTLLILFCTIPLLNLSVILHLRLTPVEAIKRSLFAKGIIIYSVIINVIGIFVYLIVQ